MFVDMVVCMVFLIPSRGFDECLVGKGIVIKLYFRYNYQIKYDNDFQSSKKRRKTNKSESQFGFRSSAQSVGEADECWGDGAWRSSRQS